MNATSTSTTSEAATSTSTTPEAAVPERRSTLAGAALSAGAIGAIAAVYVSLVGIVPTFDERPLVAGVLSLGQAFILAAMIGSAYLATRRHRGGAAGNVIAGAIAGLLTGASLSLLIVAGRTLGLRGMFPNASEELFRLLTLGGDPATAAWVPALGGLVLGALTGAATVLPSRVQRSIVVGIVSVVSFGLFAGLLRVPLLSSPFATIGRQLFASEGLTLFGAVVALSGSLGAGIGSVIGARSDGRAGGAIGGVAGGVIGSLVAGLMFADAVEGFGLDASEAAALAAALGGAIGVLAGSVIGGIVAGQVVRADVRQRYREMPIGRRRIVMSPLVVAFFLLIIVLPLGLGPFFAQVVALVALYILMGLGLNITLGLAGLLDLGFVAFFAVGAYTVGLLTSTGPLGLAEWPFWAAVPFAVAIAFLFGAFLGLPILGIRGDYLAIATLGFGEIIRILAVSDLFRPTLGGPQGVTNLPRPIPVPEGDPLGGPNQIYYIALVCAAVIAFVAMRLRDSRIGRAWVAIREDEDVAEALGINLVQTKLLAYALGAAFAGLGGAVFAGLVGAVFPTSINLFVSINVAALIIVGGMGSIRGVVIGAIFLIGLPELFREFSEYRFLFYGAALILMMRFRPEGLLPSGSITRELHTSEENVDGAGQVPGAAVAARDA